MAYKTAWSKWESDVTFLLGFNASATARVISRRWNDNDETVFWWRKPEYPEETTDLYGKWSQQNDMKINASKTHEQLINFSRNGEQARIPPITMNGEQIERTDSAKILGVTISADLTWNAHVNNTVSKASKRLYMLYQLKRAGVDQRDLVRIYMSVIRPVLEYAAPVWSTSMPGYLSDKIETIQKRAMRTIFPGMDYTTTFLRLLMSKLSLTEDMTYVWTTSTKWKILTTNFITYYLMSEMCHTCSGPELSIPTGQSSN